MTADISNYEASLSSADRLKGFRLTLRGGDAGRGRAIFVDNPQAQCVRCHRVGNQGGTAGPNLTDVGKRLDREAVLLSLVDPDAVIAQGFGQTALALRDGRILVGMVKSETASELKVELSNGRVETIPASEVEERSAPKSAMPRLLPLLSQRQIRDLIEYLASLK